MARHHHTTAPGATVEAFVRDAFYLCDPDLRAELDAAEERGREITAARDRFLRSVGGFRAMIWFDQVGGWTKFDGMVVLEGRTPSLAGMHIKDDADWVHRGRVYKRWQPGTKSRKKVDREAADNAKRTLAQFDVPWAVQTLREHVDLPGPIIQDQRLLVTRVMRCGDEWIVAVPLKRDQAVWPETPEFNGLTPLAPSSFLELVERSAA